MRLVIDTNVLLVSISDKSKYHWLYKLIINGEVELYITNEILNEYQEIISQQWKSSVAESVVRTLLELPNVHKTIIHFNLQLIENDADDNKFVDCAFASNCHYLISNDKHFKVLEMVDFPKIPLITLQEFDKIIHNKNEN